MTDRPPMPRRPPEYTSPEEGIDYVETIKVYCKEPTCVWARQTDWGLLDGVLAEAFEHWRHVHGVNLPRDDDAEV